MEAGLLLNYLFVLVLLILMEGILSADNALVLAVMVKPLPPNSRPKVLFYGLAGALVLRFSALFAISWLANVWQAQAVGALYLFFVAVSNMRKYLRHQENDTSKVDNLKEEVPLKASRKDFWKTVAKVEIADLAFAVDSILAAVAVAISLKPTGIAHIGGMDIGQCLVVFVGGMAGVVLMRFAATIFVKLLDQRPKLELAAFLLVGWIAIKLAIVSLSHEALGIIPADFIHSALWQVIFFGTMIGIALWGWFTSTPEKKQEKDNA